MTTTYTATYHPNIHGLADLALPVDLDMQLRAAMVEDDTIATRLGDAITEKIQAHGVDTDTGEWLGTWSAAEIVGRLLAGRGYGTLYDSHTGESIGPATKAQREASDDAGETGAFLIDGDGEPRHPSADRQVFGALRAVYVQP